MIYNWFVVFLLSVCLCVNAASVRSPRRLKLIIDHDGGADDAMAIFMSILYDKYFNGPEVVALTTTFGNVNESQAFENSQRILDTAGRRDIPIYRGACHAIIKSIESDYFFGQDGLGDLENVYFRAIEAQDTVAAIALIELSKIYPNELIVMAIGSLTNIALAKRMDPDFESRLYQLYVGAGHIYSEYNPKPEFNAEMDVEAYHIVVDKSSPSKVTVVPFSQILATLNITEEWRKKVLGAIPTPIMQQQNKYERISFANSTYWSLLDPAVAAVVLEKCVVDEFKYSKNSIVLCGNKRGINTNDFETDNPNVRLVYVANKEYYKQLLIDIFSAEINNKAVKIQTDERGSINEQIYV